MADVKITIRYGNGQVYASVPSLPIVGDMVRFYAKDGRLVSGSVVRRVLEEFKPPVGWAYTLDVAVTV